MIQFEVGQVWEEKSGCRRFEIIGQSDTGNFQWKWLTGPGAGMKGYFAREGAVSINSQYTLMNPRTEILTEILTQGEWDLV